MASFSEQFPGKTKKVLGIEATSFHGVGIKIEGNTLSVSTGDCFMQISNITHVRTGLIAITTKYPSFIVAIIFIIALTIGAIDRGVIAAIAGVLGIVAIAIVLYLLTKRTNHYGLQVGLNCNLVYSFMSVNDAVVNEAYSFLREAIDAESFTGSRTFNFGALPSVISDATPTSVDDYQDKHTTVPSPQTQLMDELSLSLEDVRYSNELSDNYRHQLYNILMDAKEGLEYDSPPDIESSRAKFRDFARTRDSWSNLFNTIWTRPKLVEFFRGSS